MNGGNNMKFVILVTIVTTIAASIYMCSLKEGLIVGISVFLLGLMLI